MSSTDASYDHIRKKSGNTLKTLFGFLFRYHRPLFNYYVEQFSEVLKKLGLCDVFYVPKEGSSLRRYYSVYNQSIQNACLPYDYKNRVVQDKFLNAVSQMDVADFSKFLKTLTYKKYMFLEPNYTHVILKKNHAELFQVWLSFFDDVHLNLNLRDFDELILASCNPDLFRLWCNALVSDFSNELEFRSYCLEKKHGGRYFSHRVIDLSSQAMFHVWLDFIWTQFSDLQFELMTHIGFQRYNKYKTESLLHTVLEKQNHSLLHVFANFLSKLFKSMPYSLSDYLDQRSLNGKMIAEYFYLQKKSIYIPPF